MTFFIVEIFSKMRDAEKKIQHTEYLTLGL